MRLSIFALLLAALGCGGPWGPLAGGRLSGVPASGPVDDWSFATASDHMEIEVRPADPYSVKVHYYVVNGRLYVEAGENGWSRWRAMVHDDPNVRVRFGDMVYPARVVAVTEPTELAAVLPEFYAKDRDTPSPECRKEWTVEACGFTGQILRIESRPAAALVVGNGP